MSRPANPARGLTLTEELEKLEQSITLTLQEIDRNFSKAHRIVTTSIIPLVEQYGDHSQSVWEASKFWKQFFEASANVSLSGYEDLANDDDGIASPADVTANDDDSAADQSADSGHGSHGADETGQHDNDDTSNLLHDIEDDSLLRNDDVSGSTPRAPASRTEKPRFASLESPYETLKREMRGEENPALSWRRERGEEEEEEEKEEEEEDDDNDNGRDDGDDSSLLLQQRTARLPDMSMTPRPRAPAASHGGQSAQRSRDPLLHQVLDKTYRLQTTHHKPTFRVSPLKTEQSAKRKNATAAAAATGWQDSPMSSPEMAIPTLRSEAFLSPLKKMDRKRLGAAALGLGEPRTPGVSVQTPLAGRKTRDVFGDDKGGETHKYEIDWESDSDDERGLYAGMSPPKTIQFALPPAKLMQTPAREASKKIVETILLTAGAEPETSEEYSPTMVKMNEDILNESF